MKLTKRMLAAFLSALMVFSAFPASAAAVLAKGDLPSRLHTADGTVDVGDDWETTFPYGTFAFANSETAIAEGGDAALIQVCRLGGTKGRATVAVSFAPAVMPIGEDRYGYALAAGGNDLVIEAEDPLPIAQYQPVGRDPDPEETKARILRTERGDDWVFSTDAKADAYRWQVQSDQIWHFIEDATEPTMTAAKADAQGYDFRCVYTKDGVTYCTDSFGGVHYAKPAPEVLPEMPDDLDLNPPQTFSTLETDPENPYLGYTFAITFADGESVKSIRVTATEDEIPECMEQCTFTLMACNGGSLYDTANTLILAVGDNDAPEPFSVGFAEAEITADKADGYARLAVERTGGNQTMVSVAFESSDGTAQKGTDYAAVSDELSLYGDAMIQYIDIPLINDGIADDTPRDFTVHLTEMKGDSDGIGTLTRTEATVHLINTAKSDTRNLATALTDAGAVDLSGSIEEASGSAVPVSPKSLVGKQVETPAPLKAAILGYNGSDMQLQTYDYGALQLTRNSYDNYSDDYWTDSYDLLSTGFTWDGGEQTDGGWRVKSDDDASATLWLANLPQLYSSFYGFYNFTAEWAEYMSAFKNAYTYGWASVINSNGSNFAYVDCSPRVDGDTIYYKTTESLYSSWEIADDVAGLRLGLTAGWTTSSNDAISEIKTATLYRRSFNQGINLRIHTANDSDNGGLNIRTAPDGAAVLTADSGVYASIRPSITLVQNSGGITTGGKLYVGSKIRVSLGKGESRTASYSPYIGDQLSSAVYLTRADGSVVNNALISRVSGTDDFIITMLWDGMTAADIADTYTINVVMTRRQNLILDVSPSVARMTDENGQTMASINPDKTQGAWRLFQSSGKRYISVGKSTVTGSAPHFETSVTQSRIDIDSAQINGTLLTQTDLENVQWINFNRSSSDRILYNGRMYYGNEKIWLNVSDLAQKNMRFLYYHKSFLSATSVMSTAIDSVGLYWDGDNNGRIDGRYNAETGYFEIDPASGDDFIMYLTPNTDYSETIFNYAANRSGTPCQMFLKINYVMTPRALTPEPGQENLRAQVLPAFTTSVTDPSIYSALTEEQRSYRYILSGADPDGGYTADGHPMFGALASAPQFVDVPLGGDLNPAAPAMVGDQEQYVWTPDYRGNLLYPYAMPEPIILEHTIAGDNFALAPSARMVDGALTMDEADRVNLNGYLGSFVGNSTVAICVQQQAVTSDLLATNPNANLPQPEHSSLIPNNTTPDESYLSVADNENADTEGSVDSGDSESAFPEFDLNMGMEIPKINLGCTEHDFISYASNGLERVISVSIPVASYNKKPGKEGSWMGPGGTIGRAAKQWYNIALFFVCRDPLVLTATDSSYDSATALHGGSLNSSSFNVVFIISGALKFKYNPVENEYKFVQYSVGALANLFFKFKHRFAPCPLVYVFIKVGFKVNIGTGGSFEFELEEKMPIVGVHGTELETLSLRKGKTYTLPITYKTFNVKFNGKMALELYEDVACTKRVSGASNGFLNSDGGKKITVTMLRGDGYTFPGEKTYYLRLTALKNTTVTYLAMISSQRKIQYWSGVEISPEIYVNAGVGIGVELARFELYAKLNVAAAMAIAPHNFDDTFKVNSFKTTIALAYKLVLLFYSSSKDLISYTIKYDGETGKWSHSYSALGGLYGDDLGTLSVTDSSGTFDAILHLPEDPSGTQTVYRQQEQAGPFSMLSYHANDAAVPFELAGYSGSSDAAKLADGLTSGYDYKVVTLDDKNYVFYTIGRSNAQHANDNSMLVMSQLVMSGVQPGLVNPVDPDSDTPYIPVDVLANKTADPTGDLAFHASAQSGMLTATWISYADVTTRNGETTFDTFDRAVHNTVVKTAHFTPGMNSFTPAVTVSGDVGENVNTPVATGSAVIYTQARHASREALERQTALYRAYLSKIGYGADTDDPARKEIGEYRLATQATLTNLSGIASTLCVSVNGAPRGNAPLPDGQTVANLEAACIDGVYYIVYTTEETCYTDAAGNTIADPASAESPDRLSIKRLYLRTFTLGEDNTVQWQQGGKAILLRTLYDFDQNAACSDGLYQGGACSARYDDPYFSNLQFLTARLGDQLAGEEEDFSLQSAGKETFLLFDMNGATYLIRQASLASIANAQHGSILPFFKEEAPSDEAETQGKTTTGRGETTIGADGAGNLAAVYVAPVENTTNNALYLAKFDPESGLWGSGTILAMNHLGVYEENIAKHRNNEESERAYLGQNSDSTLGGMDQFVFSNPQIALGPTTETLLVLTQGKMSYLKEVTQDEETLLVPVADADVTRREYPRSVQAPAGLGVYAIGYGIGQQAIGNASLSLLNYDFSAGADLETTVRFSNIGDVGIRGSEQQPITVTLSTDDNGMTEELSSWTITENIIPGQNITVSGGCTLSRTLGDGAKFMLTVKESEDYAAAGGAPYCASVSLLTLENRPELGFEHPSFELIDVDPQGNAVITVDAVAGNRGSEQAKHTFVQFSYDTGYKDEGGASIFAPLDIRSSDLEQTDMQLLSVLSNDYKNGVLALGTLEAGYGKHITGTIAVSAAQFRNLATGCLALRAELFCDADDVEADASGLYVGTHRDYNNADNRTETQIEHRTTFLVPNRITVPMGNTLRLPLSLTTTTGDAAPDLQLAEFPEQNSDMHFGIRSLRDVSYDAGHGSGTLVLSPGSEGSGYLRIEDANTNDFYDIAYTVTPAADGINIYNDNNLFTFLNADGTVFDPGATSESQNWVFDSVVPIWGADGTIPYLSNLAKGQIGSSFTFTTQAESIDFIFDGEVRVESDLPDFHPVMIRAGGGDGLQPDEFASVQFSANGTNQPHTVTVTVTGAAGNSGVTTYFDRLVEHFNANQGVPVPAEDAASPHIYWSRSFPDTASLETGAALPLRAYIIDDRALASVTVNGQTPQSLTQAEDGYWIVDLTLNANGDLILEAVDEAGNRTAHSLTVDWFNAQTTAGTSAAAPAVEAELLKVDGETATPLTPETPFGGQDEAHIQAQGTSTVAGGSAVLTATYLFIDDSGLEESDCSALSPGTYRAEGNGWYLIKATDPAPNDQQWSQTVVRMTRFGEASMEAALTFDEESKTIGWSAESLGGSPIVSVAVNGQPIEIPADSARASGTFTPAFSGLYTLRVTDAQGNVAAASCTVFDLPIVPAEGKTAADAVTAVGIGHVTKGSVTVHPAALTGGLYNAASGVPDSGVYEWRLEPADGESIDALVHTDGWSASATYADLERGDYVVYIRDAQDPLNTAVAAAFPVTIGTEAFTHDWDNGTITTPATCSAEGVKTFHCPTCGATRTEPVEKDPANHVHVTEDPGKPATCTEPGWSAFKRCEDCGKDIVAREELPQKEHNWDEGVITTAATCAAAGVKTVTCIDCGATRTEPIGKDPSNHIHTTRYRGKRPTCTEAGWSVYELCDDCGAEIVAREVLPATDHNWSSGTVTTPATCSAAGEKSFKCRACGATRTEPIEKDPANHVHVTQSPGKPATCTEPGWTASKHCDDCGTDLVAREELPATGHKWNAGRITTPATCTAAGEKTFTCADCGATRTEPVEKDPAHHIHVTEDPGKPATCTEPGWTASKHCDDCGTDLVAREELPAAGHKWNAGRITTPATCIAAGEKTFTCADCGATRTEPVEKDPAHHIHVTEDPGKLATCTEPGWSAFRHCDDCGAELVAREELPAAGHKWDAGKITTPATCAAAGETTFTCTACGATRTEPVEKDPANHIHVDVEPGKPATCTEAGISDSAVCMDCGTVLSEHIPIDPIDHELPAGRIYGNCIHCGVFRCCMCKLYESKRDVPVLGFFVRIAHAILHPITHLWFRIWNKP